MKSGNRPTLSRSETSKARILGSQLSNVRWFSYECVSFLPSNDCNRDEILFLEAFAVEDHSVLVTQHPQLHLDLEPADGTLRRVHPDEGVRLARETGRSDARLKKQKKNITKDIRFS